MKNEELEDERKRITEESKLQSFHWVVLALSLIITLFAFFLSKKQINDKVKEEFDRESDQVVELIQERMDLYENALQGASSFFNASEKVSLDKWRTYSSSLSIDTRYPGIKGIGAIFRIKDADLESFIKEQKKDRPFFDVHPDIKSDYHWVITYIEPEITNKEAVGLDMVFEKNRIDAIEKSVKTGKSQITGPIKLVQDEHSAPGFLFYSPFYKDGKNPKSLNKRIASVVGVSYSPFIVKKLMDGTLDKSNRHVSISITDGEEIIFNEHQSSFATYDPNPIFTNEYIVQIYGRTWKFNLHSDKTFYAKNKNGQPILILLGGFFIDGLLFFIFIILTKKNKTAISFADKVSEELEEKNKNLKYRNKDLETLLHVSSHDLREPLRAIKNFSSMVNLKHSSGLNKRGKDLLFRIERGANKMENLLDDITSLSKAQRKKMEFEKINAKDLINPILEDMREEIEVSKSNIVVSDNLPEIIVDKVWAYRAIYNLISNSIKFTKEGEAPYILITPYISGDQSGVVIRDRGIGIREENCEKIFDLFRRDVGNEFEGTGAGLSIVRQIAIRHSGDAWAESVEGGSQFTISFLAKR